METLTTLLFDLYAVWQRGLIFVMVWMLCVLAAAILISLAFNINTDRLTWFIWPFLLGSLVFTPVVYAVARFDWFF